MSNDTDNRVSELDAAARERDALAAVIEEARGYAQNRLTAKTGIVLDEYSKGAQDGYEQAMRGLDVILSRTPSDALVERDARVRAEVIDWLRDMRIIGAKGADLAREHFGLTKGADRG